MNTEIFIYQKYKMIKMQNLIKSLKKTVFQTNIVKKVKINWN